MADEVRAEVWFEQEDEVTVTLTGYVSDPERQRLYEMRLFCWFAAQAMVSIGGKAPALRTLGEALRLVDGDAPLASVKERIEALGTAHEPTRRKGFRRRGFTVVYRPGQRRLFSGKAPGFTWLHRASDDYYGEMSVLSLLYFLLRGRADDHEYQRALAAAARGIGNAARDGRLRLFKHAEIALVTANTAWTEEVG